MQTALMMGNTLQLTQHDKIKVLSAAICNGENALRFMAQVIGAGPCPKCDFVITHCKCPKE